MGSRSSKELAKFIEYCEEHPGERFWQALRNWSGAVAIWEQRTGATTSVEAMMEDFNTDCEQHECCHRKPFLLVDTFYKE